MKKFHPSPIAAVILMVYANAYAQPSDVLPEVQVHARRYTPTPQLSGQLSASELVANRAATSDTASLLQDVVGVNLFSAGGVSSLPVIHGLADDRLRVKVDGMDLLASCPNHMNPALSYMDPSQIGQLQVYAGITPVSVGGDSIGGTILAASPSPEFAPIGQSRMVKGEMGSYYRSNNHATGLNLAASQASESFSISYRGASAQADNYQAGGNFKNFTATGNGSRTLALDEVGSTAYETRNHQLDLAWRDTANLYEIKLGHQDLPYQLYPNQRMDMLGNTQNRINLHWVGSTSWGSLDARVYSETVNHYMDFGQDKQFIYGTAPYVVATGMPMYTQGKTQGVSIRADIDASEHDLLRMGTDVQTYRLNDWWPPSPADLTGMLFSATNPVQATYAGMAPNTFWNINGGKRDRIGVFTEWEAKWSPQWTSLLGARIEQVRMDTGNVQGYNDVANNMMYSTGYLISATQFNALDRKRTDTNVDLTALARHAPDDTHTYEFGYAQKTRSPNLYERYSWSRNAMALIMNNFVGDGNGYLGNPDLKPEVAHTLSATANWHNADRSSELKLAPFYTQVTDYIDAVQWNRSTNLAAPNTINQFGILKYMNQDARLYGLDISGHTPLASNSLGSWRFKGMLNYTHARNLETGSGLYNVMPLNAKLALQQQAGNWGNTLELVLVKAKTNISEPRQEIQTPGYSLVHWRASYKQSNWRLDFGVENLLNKFYSLPLGGAYTGQGSTMSLTGIPYGIAVPGMGRSFYAGAHLTF